MQSDPNAIVPRCGLTEILHGVPVADPFRTLENADDPATRAWVDAENALTRRLLDGPARDAFVQQLRRLHRHPRTSVAAVRGTRLFFTETDGTRNQPVLYMAGLKTCPTIESARPTTELYVAGLKTGPTTVSAQDSSPAGKRILVDPNVIDPSGTTAITAFEPDDDGTRVVYALSRAGSDVQELFVHDVAARGDLPDRIRWVKFASIAWAGDGFFYTRFPEPGCVPPEHEQYFCQVRHHRLGGAQCDDALIFERPDAPEIVFDIDVTSDGRHLVIVSRRGASDKAEVHVVSAAAPGAGTGSARALVTGFADAWHFAGSAGDALYFVTDADAPTGRIVSLDLGDVLPRARTILPAAEDTIVEAALAAGRLIVSSLHNASGRLRRVDLDGGDVRELALPGLGTIVGIGGRCQDSRCCVTFTSFTTPPQILECDLDACGVAPVDSSLLPIDPSAYTTTQAWYPSRDGSPISMFLTVRRADAPSTAPQTHRSSVLLSGYGGFNISLTPAFDPSDFVWLDAGGTIAVANLRGGGEYGETWHQAGMLERKQNVFDDFIAAAEWLRRERHAAHIAIEGASNGGLLVAAAMVQRPDLFDAVVCRVPVADMLRYHLFTVGRFWIPEYGSAERADQFPFLLRYSPYHNVADGASYPPALIMTADTDDRVAPGMAKKFAARLQEAARSGGGPILLRVETRAGHGAGKSIARQIDEQADICAFLFSYTTEKSGSV